MPSVHECVANSDFDKSIFDECYDHSGKVFITWINRVTPELAFVKNYDYRAHSERIFKEEAERQKGFFLELYEIHGDERTIVGYMVASILDKTMYCNTGLTGKRISGSRTVMNVGPWIAMFEAAKGLGCDKFVYLVDMDGRQRKALYMMGSRLDYPVTYTDVQYDKFSKVTPEGNPMKEMRIIV